MPKPKDKLLRLLSRAGKHLEQSDLPAAEADLKRASGISPNHPQLHFLWGAYHGLQGNLNAAEEAFRRVVRAKPSFAPGWYNLGHILHQQDRIGEAIEAYERVVKLNSKDPLVYYNLGLAWQRQEDLVRAEEAYRQSLAIAPTNPDALNNLGNVLKNSGRLEEAVSCYRQALRLQPGHTRALSSLTHQLQCMCAWEELAPLIERVLQRVESGGGHIPPFALIALPSTPALQHRCATEWVQENVEIPVSTGATVEPMVRDASKEGGPLRVGFVSSDFCEHVVAHLIADVVEAHDPARLELSGYSFGQNDGSEIRSRLVSGFDRFVDIRKKSHAEAGAVIRADGIQVLVDLKGLTQGNRMPIFAAHPAPVQVRWLGHAGTSGAPFCDYILADSYVLPKEQQPFYTEEIVHLPSVYQVCRRVAQPGMTTRADHGLPEGGCVFCCFNGSYKIDPAVFAVWMELLKEIPESLLWLLEDNPHVPPHLRAAAEEAGISAERLIFAPRIDRDQHLQRYQVADICLDTLYVSACATTGDALWQACPMVTCVGETFASRAAGSLMRTAGLSEWVASDLAEYRELALTLARDEARRLQIREALQASRETSPLFDVQAFTRHLEDTLLGLWQRSVDSGG